MKLIVTAILTSSVAAFVPANPSFHRPSVAVYNTDGLDLSGNAWKPDSEKMGSTDTGDYFPEGYEPDIAFTAGMSKAPSNDRGGPQLPGLENLGEDAVMMGGIEENTDIPAGMEFIAASVPDGELSVTIASNSSGKTYSFEIKPVCMGFEDYYAAFTSDSHPSLSVSPQAGRMDRRGGESTFLSITCAPNGKSGMFSGDLVVNLPEDNSKFSYKINMNSV